MKETFDMTAVPRTIMKRKPYMSTLMNLRIFRLVSLLLLRSLGIVWKISQVDLKKGKQNIVQNSK